MTFSKLARKNILGLWMIHAMVMQKVFIKKNYFQLQQIFVRLGARVHGSWMSSALDRETTRNLRKSKMFVRHDVESEWADDEKARMERRLRSLQLHKANIHQHPHVRWFGWKVWPSSQQLCSHRQS
jgi:hypothetical protein